MRMSVGRLVALVLGAVVCPLAGATAQGETARSLVGGAAEWMGGESELRAVRYVEFDMMTVWQRTSFRGVPHFDRPSFERHVDRRDYASGGWRNRRDFGARSITNVIIDSVAVTDMGQGFQPLSAAYVDERNELFIYTPDRLILALLDAADLMRAPDTLIAGEPHHVVRATLADRYPSRVYLNAGTGLPTVLRFHAGHPNDFGLVQWGDMDVEVWYSNWRTFDGIVVARQWDITRVGVPYKRLTLLNADFARAQPDSLFAIAPSVRSEYWASLAPRPMHEARTIEAIERPNESIAILKPGFGTPAAAVDHGDGWLLLGAGQAEYNYDQTLARMADESVTISNVVIADSRPGNGGVVSAARRGTPILVAPGAEAGVRTMLRNHGATEGTVEVVRDLRTFGRGAERVMLAPIDLPDAPGSLLVYKPSLQWLLVLEGVDPVYSRMARARAEELGWSVVRMGTPRDLWGASGIQN